MPIKLNMPEASNSNVEVSFWPSTVADPDLYTIEIPSLIAQVGSPLSEPLEPELVNETLQLGPLSTDRLAVSKPPDPAMLMVVISVSVMGSAPDGDVNVNDISSEQAHLPTNGSVVEPPPVALPEVESPVQAAQAITQDRKPPTLSLLMTRPPPNKKTITHPTSLSTN